MSFFRSNISPLLLNGLVGYWQFSNNANDSSVNGFNGTLINSPTYVNGVNRGHAINLISSSTQYINMGTNLTIVDVHDKTISAWIKPITLAQFGIIDKDFDSGGSNYGGWGMWLQSNGKLWWWALGGGFDQEDTNLAVSLGIWSHVLITWSTTTKIVSFYINGTFSSSITGNAGQIEKPSGSNNFTIGSLRNGTNTFNGAIDEVRIYNRILSFNEITQLYNYK